MNRGRNRKRVLFVSMAKAKLSKERVEEWARNLDPFVVLLKEGKMPREAQASRPFNVQFCCQHILVFCFALKFLTKLCINFLYSI